MFTGLREGQDVVIKQFTKMVKVDFCRGEYAFMDLYAIECNSPRMSSCGMLSGLDYV